MICGSGGGGVCVLGGGGLLAAVATECINGKSSVVSPYHYSRKFFFFS